MAPALALESGEEGIRVKASANPGGLLRGRAGAVALPGVFQRIECALIGFKRYAKK